jgi:hypothetical protein
MQKTNGGIETNNEMTDINEIVEKPKSQLKSTQSSILRDLRREEMAQGLYDLPSNNQSTGGSGVSGDNACPCFGCQCEPNQVTKDAIEEARNQNEQA